MIDPIPPDTRAAQAEVERIRTTIRQMERDEIALRFAVALASREWEAPEGGPAIYPVHTAAQGYEYADAFIAERVTQHARLLPKSEESKP